MSDTQDQLLEEFNAAAGDAGDPVQEAEDLTNEAATLTEMVSESEQETSEVAASGAEFQSTSREEADNSTEPYTLGGITGGGRRIGGSESSGTFRSDGTAPPAYNPTDTPAKPNSTGNTGVTGLGVAETVLESGLGIVPLALGIMSLFEGTGNQPEALTRYAMPDPIEFSGDSGSNETEQDSFDQTGMLRANVATAQTNQTQEKTTVGATSTPGSSQPSPTLQTTTQPGDPQWFMDHSNAIAQAVRSAMLNLSCLNDVVSDL